MKNYYAILGIRQNATVQDIKEAYKKMCYSTEKFSEIWEAYKVLSDPEKRANFDKQIDFSECFESRPLKPKKTVHEGKKSFGSKLTNNQDISEDCFTKSVNLQWADQNATSKVNMKLKCNSPIKDLNDTKPPQSQPTSKPM